MLEELRDHIQECIEDQNGSHVIQKIFETILHDQLSFVIKIVVDNVNLYFSLENSSNLFS